MYAMKKLLLLCLLCVLPYSGCTYFQDRLKDASEIVEVGVGFSMGLDLNVRATKAVQVGFGSYSGYWAGLKEGHAHDVVITKEAPNYRTDR